MRCQNKNEPELPESLEYQTHKNIKQQNPQLPVCLKPNAERADSAFSAIIILQNTGIKRTRSWGFGL